MSLADELLKLEQLRSSEALTAQEFEDAKRALLYPATPAAAHTVHVPAPMSSSFDRSATEYFERQNRRAKVGVVWSVFVGIIMLIIVIAVLSGMNSSSDDNQCVDNGFATGCSP